MSDAGRDNGKRRDKPLCGGKKRQGSGTCTRPAGWGTDHPGIGRCKLHGGSTPNHRKHAARVEAEVLAQAMRDELVASMDELVEIDYRDAVLIELSRSQAWVNWLNRLVVTSTDLKQVDMSGKFERPSVWYELLAKERGHLLDVIKTAGTLGIEERRIRLAERQGELIVDVVRRILDGLGLSADQQALVPHVVGRELRAASIAAASELAGSATEKSG